MSVKIAEDMVAFLTTGEASSAVNLPRISAEQLGRTRPYQHLAHALGRVIAAITPEPITEMEIGLFGRAAELDPRPIMSQALVGLLDKRLAVVNQVNAIQLAQRQGIAVREVRSEVAHDYLALVEVRATTASGPRRVWQEHCWASACRGSFASMITKWKRCPKGTCCSLATTTARASLAHSAAFLAERISISRACRSESLMERMRQLRSSASRHPCPKKRLRRLRRCRPYDRSSRWNYDVKAAPI